MAARGMRACAAMTMALLLVLCSIRPAQSWCWIRDTGRTGADCGPDEFQTDCCDGALRVWFDANMTYRISTNTLPGLYDDIHAGFSRWNAVKMSTFTFTYGGTTSATQFFLDDINLVNIDDAFCTSNPDDCDQGILGFSGTWSSTAGGYHAVESDIILNGEEYVWGDGSAGMFDTLAVIAHEAGHSAGLSHAGSTCRSGGSSGCGADFPSATMYYSYSGGQPTDKGSLELDDVAALVNGYPLSRVRVQVLDIDGLPVSGATVELLQSAAPVDGDSIAQGGRVMGDVTNPAVLMGDGVSSPTYVAQSPFAPTDADGLTDFISPLHSTGTFSVSHFSMEGETTMAHTPGDTTVTLVLSGSLSTNAPTLEVTSHSDGHRTNEMTVTLAGTASDAGRGGSGISELTVNGVAAQGGAAVGDQTAVWSLEVELAEGDNLLTVIARDGDTPPNEATVELTVHLDLTPPTVTEVAPRARASGQPPDVMLAARFSEPLQHETVNRSSFTLDGEVTGRVVYNPETGIATFVPDAPLARGVTYTATLDASILDLAANALEPFSWEFAVKPASDSSSDDGGCFLHSLQNPRPAKAGANRPDTGKDKL